MYTVRTRGKKNRGGRFLAAVFVMCTVVLVICSTVCRAGAATHAGKKVVRISCGVNELLSYDEDGDVTGYCKEYLDALEKVNNWQFEYVKSNWSQAVKMLETGELDILFPTTMMEERKQTMEYSAMIGGYMAPGLFVRQDSNYSYGDYASFNGAKIAVTESSSNSGDLKEFAEKHNFSYEPVYIDSMQEKIEAMQDGRVDMVLFSAANRVPDAKVVSVLEAYPFYYTVKKGNTDLLAELNQGMQQIMISHPSLVGELFQGCITGDNTHLFAFSPEERAVIENKTKITVGFYEQTEPLAYVDSDGKYDGIYIEIAEKLKSEAGLNIELYPISRDYNWSDLIRDGTIDFYMGASESISQKDADYFVTDSFTEYKTVFVTEHDFKIQEKKKVKLALTYARAYWDENLPPYYRDAEVTYYKTARECLLAVKRKSADATLLNTVEFNYQTKNPRFSSLIQWENYRFDSGTSLVALKDIDPAVFSVVNKSLGALTESEVSNIVNKHINMPYEEKDFWDHIYPARMILLYLLFVFAVCVAAIFLIRRVRRKQNAFLLVNREKEKQQLRIMAALSLDYTVIYYVNLDTDHYSVVKNRREIWDVFDTAESEPRIYSRTIQDYIDARVLPEYREGLADQMEIGAIISRFKEEKNFSIRYRINPNERGEDFFEMHCVDISTEEGEQSMVLGIRCVDSAAREELEQKKVLREAFEAANKANHAKSDFLSKMSHDIRTPMNAIIGMTAIAKTHIDDKERVQDALGKITSASQHLLGLINEVLDMSKIESGKISLTEEEFKLSELLNNLLVMIQPQIKQHGHNLQVRVLDIEHEAVIGDSLRIQQMFVNIMGNAIKYTPDGGTISLTVREKPVHKLRSGCYEFVVEDNGIGMSKEFLKHIFEPFSRVEDVRTSKIQGTGLGMAITQNIVRMMNGDIEVESEEGKGSKFTITFFLKLREEEFPPEEFSGLNVLVVDDDEISSEATSRMLTEIGIDSEWVTSGEEAVERVASVYRDGREFHAIILDWQMPGMNGVETTKAIKKIVGSDVPVIILSAYDWSDVEMEARSAGVDMFMNKPVFKSGFVKLFRKLKNGTVDEDEDIKSDYATTIENDYTGKRALIVEDNDLNREIATEVLKSTGIETEEAENGKIAVDMFADSEPGYYDIIFMDVQMPIMDGYTATSAIRSLKRRDASKVPIVAMTANAFVEDVRAAKNSGMNEHLAKPFELEKLAAVLKKYLD